MKVYAVIDTNVLVSALLAKRPDSAPVQILDRLFSRDFIPMYNEEIVAEYNEVLRRPKFKFPEEQIAFAVETLFEAGIFLAFFICAKQIILFDSFCQLSK